MRPVAERAWQVARLAPIRFVAVIVIAFALATFIDPYLGWGSPWFAQAINAVLPVLLVLVVWGLSGRAWVALLVEIIALGVLVYANNVKVMNLNADVVYADFTILPGLLQDPRLVLGFVHVSARKIAAVVIVVVAVALFAWFTRRWRGAGWRLRVACLVLAGAGIATVALLHAPDEIPAVQWQVYAQPTGAKAVGIAGNILLGRMTTQDIKRPPNPAAERAFWNEPLVRQAEAGLATTGNGVRPDIVIVQSESLFMPSQLCGFPSSPLLKHLVAQQPHTLSSLHVPVFGGRTLQTEFEVLTGAPISYYPGSMFAYYELVHHSFDALPRVLDGDGYETVAIHPNQRTFWNRDVAFPDMGFQTFQSIGSFIYPRDYAGRGFVSDATLVRAILAELDAANRPAFAMAISINNHGPWGGDAPKDDAGLDIPANLHGTARRELADYVEHAVDYDNAYGFLLDALQRRGRPTVVVTYGDHMPALPKVYQKLCFKNGRSAEDHEPPYRIWANFPMPTPPPTTYAYLLQGWLMHVAGLPLKGQMLANYLAGVIADNPKVDAADRTRILAEYANIAAANVAARLPPVWHVGTAFFGQDRALDLLMKHQSGSEPGTSVVDGDLHMQPDGAQPAHIEFDLDSALASLSLRPYLATPTLACRRQPAAERATIEVAGDGRDLYRAFLTPETVRLATLDVQGVRRLSITVRGTAPDADHCDAARVRVAQMMCYSARCNVPGPAPTPDSPARLPSRILTSDPMPGDIAHLASLAPWRSPRTTGKLANVEWMLGRETADRVGYAPFTVQPDAQLFMHPAEDHGAWIDFNVAGVDSIELSPRINPLSPECLALKQPGVGVVDVKLLLDGKPLQPPLVVDRDYDKALTLDVRGGKTLQIHVDKGGSVNACDWFSVGFLRLTGPAVPKTLVQPTPPVAAATPVAASATSTAVPPAAAKPVVVPPGAVVRDYPSAAEEQAMHLGYPLFLAYGSDSARLTPFFPGSSERPLSVRLGPDPAGYDLQAQGGGCAFPVAYELRSAAGEILARGTYRGTRSVGLAGWDTGSAVLNVQMAAGATNNYGCMVVVNHRARGGAHRQ